MSTPYGTAIRSARAQRGITQTQLAEISGIKQSNISAIERGRRHPSADTLHRLLFACGFELIATGGARTFHLALPDSWFDDDPAASEAIIRTR